MAALKYGSYAAQAYSAVENLKQAKDLRRQGASIASNTRASGQRQAELQRRQAELLRSRGQAVAAASGAGASDPTVMNLLADIEGQGEMNALTTMFESEEAARETLARARAGSRELRAKALGRGLELAGDVYVNRKRDTGTSKVMAGGSTLADKYGDPDLMELF